MRRQVLNLLGGAVAGIALISLMGPTGGLPSRPTFQQVIVSSANPLTIIRTPGAPADAKNTLLRGNTNGGMAFWASTDAAPSTPVQTIINTGRSGLAWSSLTFGNAADNPTFSFLGTGQSTFGGSVTVTGTSSTVAHVVNGATNQWTQRLDGSAVAGQSYGLLVRAGTNSTDRSIEVQNQSGTTRMRIAGDGTTTFTGTNFIVSDGTSNNTIAGNYIQSNAGSAQERYRMVGDASNRAFQTWYDNGNAVRQGYLGFNNTGVATWANEITNGSINLVATGGSSVVAFTAGSITANGSPVVTNATLPAIPAETTGSFSGAFTTACTTTPSGSFTWTKLGNIVVLNMSANISCTSDTSTFAVDAGALPAAIRPPSNLCAALVGATDNTSANGVANVRIQADGGINFAFGGSGAATSCSASNWTSSGTKMLGPFTVTYKIN